MCRSCSSCSPCMRCTCSNQTSLLRLHGCAQEVRAAFVSVQKHRLNRIEGTRRGLSKGNRFLVEQPTVCALLPLPGWGYGYAECPGRL